jgi:hypothetical protein
LHAYVNFSSAKHKLSDENKKIKKNKSNMNYLIICRDYFIERHEKINIIKRAVSN